jgi:hypothetical protein
LSVFNIKNIFQEETLIGMEKNERELWWKVIEECWVQDPHARPSMDTVAKKLMDLRQTLFERI